MTTSRLRLLSLTPIVVHTLCIALLGGALLLAAQTKKEGDPSGPQNFTKDVAVAMRDGVVLRADVWLPAASGKFPVLVYRTPYGKHLATKQTTFQKAIERGYAVMICDVRGRYASDGEFWPYQYEGRDGYDTIEWAAQQGWSDGGVGTFGLSYPGAVAGGGGNSAALESHGSGDDVFHPAEFLLFGWRIRRLVAGLDVVQHRAGFATEEKLGRTANTCRGGGGVEDRA
jgi:hypothetical protein